MVDEWDFRFLALAAHVAEWSRDPSTKTGAVIVRPDKTVASMGFNGFPRGIRDDPLRYEDREEKYRRIVHCEMNAMMFARESLFGYTLYTFPFLTCGRCALHVIQVGIKRVVAPICPFDKSARWYEDFTRARSYYAEAGVQFSELEF